jgi:hypothetical protein
MKILLNVTTCDACESVRRVQTSLRCVMMEIELNLSTLVGLVAVYDLAPVV